MSSEAVVPVIDGRRSSTAESCPQLAQKRPDSGAPQSAQPAGRGSASGPATR
jgi:hypothetical protein